MAKGSGHLFRPTFPPTGQSYAEAKAAGTLRESPTWWMQFSVDGKRCRESTNTTKLAEAKKQLALRTGAAAKGEAIAPKLDPARRRSAGTSKRSRSGSSTWISTSRAPGWPASARPG